ncbi:MAG: pyridoxamine 5'-phosphate oxidase family protein, partial [Boseongicola sp.]
MIDIIEQLEALYGTPKETSTRKVATKMVPVYRRWVERSRFCILSTVGPEGTDASPRGDDGSVVTVIDAKTLAMPDWRGNDRIDSLRNIIRDPRLALMFMVPGSTNVVRVNGRGKIVADAEMLERFQRGRALPRSVILIAIDEVYFQCSRAIMRSRLWSDDGDADG